jgi:thioredoxin-like negative regulator of GroEL
MDRVYLMGGTLALAGGLLLARGIRILWKGEASLADALPVFGLLGKLFLSGFQLKGGWARVASIPIFLLSLTALAGGGSLIALKYFRPQELEGVMLSAAAKLAKDSPSDGDKKAVAGETVGQMKDLLAGLKTSSQARADAAVTVPEADLGPIPVSHPMGNDFRKFVETPGKLSVVILEVPQDEAAVKLREMIERVGRRFSNVAQVAYFDLDTWPELGEEQGVTQVPDVRFFRDGKKVDGFVGVPVKDVVLLEKFVRHSQGFTGETPVTGAMDSPNNAAQPAAPSSLRTPTPAMRELTDQNFQAFVSQPDCLAVVVYEADWCPACVKLKPLLKIVAAEYGEVAEVGCVNVEKVSSELARKRNSNKIPVIQYYRNGKLITGTTGCPALATLRARFDDFTRELRGQRVEAAKSQMTRTTDEPAVQPMKKGWIPAGMEKR